MKSALDGVGEWNERERSSERAPSARRRLRNETRSSRGRESALDGVGEWDERERSSERAPSDDCGYGTKRGVAEDVSPRGMALVNGMSGSGRARERRLTTAATERNEEWPRT